MKFLYIITESLTRRNILKNFQKSIMWSLVSAKRLPSLENAYLVKGMNM